MRRVPHEALIAIRRARPQIAWTPAGEGPTGPQWTVVGQVTLARERTSQNPKGGAHDNHSQYSSR